MFFLFLLFFLTRFLIIYKINFIKMIQKFNVCYQIKKVRYQKEILIPSKSNLIALNVVPLPAYIINKESIRRIANINIIIS